ncbi:rust resistance kinase Lr10-like [Tasmannia lanceolata]|uniref:rust resistance kinase Lr10-like n=1 Tax=Tasmannia lanceolata TaxID=3420 RepID=UPI0040638868
MSSNFPWTSSSGGSSSNYPWTSSSGASSSFDEGIQSANDTMKWFTIAAIVTSIVGTVATVAIVFAIINCLRKTGTAIPEKFYKYASIPMSPPEPSYDTDAFSDGQIEAGTIERFIKGMVRERPIRFSAQQLASFTKNYAVKLGSGGYGDVYKGELPDGVLVAVKVLNRKLDKGVEGQFMAEVGTIGRVHHINLVRLYGFCFDATMKALVYEFMENGSLDKLLFSEVRKIEWEKLYEIAIGTAKGIAYLHEECQQRIIHYDIKPGNVLLDTNFNPKVADFGLAKLCDRENTHVSMSVFRGTPGYAAPELWTPFPITHKCDVYSFGVMLFEIVGRRRNVDDNLTESQQWFPRWVWQKYDKGELREMVAHCGIDENDREKAERMTMVALWCVQYSPEARPPMSSVVKILEGGAEIFMPPPNPFQHLESGSIAWGDSNVDSKASGGTDEISDSTASGGTAEICGKDSTPIMKKYEIEMAILP